MSQPDGIDRAECPICKRLTDTDELLDNAGLCMRCDHEQTEVINDVRATEPQGEEDDREED